MLKAFRSAGTSTVTAAGIVVDASFLPHPTGASAAASRIIIIHFVVFISFLSLRDREASAWKGLCRLDVREALAWIQSYQVVS